jgi:hypothetical protein
MMHTVPLGDTPAAGILVSIAEIAIGVGSRDHVPGPGQHCELTAGKTGRELDDELD